MKALKPNIVFVILSITILFSCDKDILKPRYDSGYCNLITLNGLELKYNQIGKVDKMIRHLEESGNQSLIHYEFKYQQDTLLDHIWYYNVNLKGDTIVPMKIFAQFKYAHGKLIKITYRNRVVYDSIMYVNGSIKSYRVILYSNDLEEIAATSLYELTYNNKGNVSNYKRTNLKNNEVIKDFNYEYDTYRNPHYRNEFALCIEDFVRYCSKNNWTKQSEKVISSDNVNTTNTMIYNEYGYPIEWRYEVHGNMAPAVFTLMYDCDE